MAWARLAENPWSIDKTKADDRLTGVTELCELDR